MCSGNCSISHYPSAAPTSVTARLGSTQRAPEQQTFYHMSPRIVKLLQPISVFSASLQAMGTKNIPEYAEY